MGITFETGTIPRTIINSPLEVNFLAARTTVEIKEDYTGSFGTARIGTTYRFLNDTDLQYFNLNLTGNINFDNNGNNVVVSECKLLIIDANDKDREQEFDLGKINDGNNSVVIENERFQFYPRTILQFLLKFERSGGGSSIRKIYVTFKDFKIGISIPSQISINSLEEQFPDYELLCAIILLMSIIKYKKLRLQDGYSQVHDRYGS